MSVLHLYPLSCALNLAASWTLDSWLACSVQLLPSGQRQPKRQLQSTFEKVEKQKTVTTAWKFTLKRHQVGWMHDDDKSDFCLQIWAVCLRPSHLWLLPILTQWWFITVSLVQYGMVKFCHFSEEFLSFIHGAVSFKSNCRSYYVRHSILMTLHYVMDDFIMTEHGVIGCLTLPVHFALAGWWSPLFNAMQWLAAC